MMKYAKPNRTEEVVLNQILDSGSVGDVCELLISLGLYTEHTRDVKDILVKNARSFNKDIASAALIAFAHLARRNKDINLEEFMSLVKNIPLRSDLEGVIQDVVDDIIMFSNKS